MRYGDPSFVISKYFDCSLSLPLLLEYIGIAMAMAMVRFVFSGFGWAKMISKKEFQVSFLQMAN